MQEYIHVGKASDLAETSDRRLYRFLEIMPGFLAWATLIVAIVFSFILPVYVAVFIILFDVYWLLKAVYVSLHLHYTYKKMRENMKRDWLAELKKLSVQAISSWSDVYHLVILPMATEPLEVVRESFVELAKIKYPLNKLIVVLAIEERAGQKAQDIANTIKNDFDDKFF